MTEPTKVDVTQTPAGPDLKIEQTNGPLLEISSQGVVKVARGTQDEAARMFWEAVNFQGKTFSDRIRELEQQLAALNLDPFRAIVHGGAYDVRVAMKHKIPLADVDHVLTTINDMAKRVIQ